MAFIEVKNIWPYQHITTHFNFHSQYGTVLRKLLEDEIHNSMQLIRVYQIWITQVFSSRMRIQAMILFEQSIPRLINLSRNWSIKTKANQTLCQPSWRWWFSRMPAAFAIPWNWELVSANRDSGDPWVKLTGDEWWYKWRIALIWSCKLAETMGQIL